MSSQRPGRDTWARKLLAAPQLGDVKPPHKWLAAEERPYGSTPETHQRILPFMAVVCMGLAIFLVSVVVVLFLPKGSGRSTFLKEWRLKTYDTDSRNASRSAGRQKRGPVTESALETDSLSQTLFEYYAGTGEGDMANDHDAEIFDSTTPWNVVQGYD